MGWPGALAPLVLLDDWWKGTSSGQVTCFLSSGLQMGPLEPFQALWGAETQGQGQSGNPLPPHLSEAGYGLCNAVDSTFFANIR